MAPWDIIGWTIIVLFLIGILVVPSLKILFRLRAHKRSRAIQPAKHQIWYSLFGKPYYINKVDSTHLLISTSANNNGGSYYSLKEWERLVDIEKLFRDPKYLK
jgi:hypothetical protein